MSHQLWGQLEEPSAEISAAHPLRWYASASIDPLRRRRWQRAPQRRPHAHRGNRSGTGESAEGDGHWLAKYGESIYGTRGGPFKPGDYGVSTRKGNTIYLHVLEWPDDMLKLPVISARVLRSRVLSGGKAEVREGASGLEVSVAGGDRQPMDTVVALGAGPPRARPRRAGRAHARVAGHQGQSHGVEHLPGASGVRARQSRGWQRRHPLGDRRRNQVRVVGGRSRQADHVPPRRHQAGLPGAQARPQVRHRAVAGRAMESYPQRRGPRPDPVRQVRSRHRPARAPERHRGHRRPDDPGVPALRLKRVLTARAGRSRSAPRSGASPAGDPGRRPGRRALPLAPGRPERT